MDRSVDSIGSCSLDVDADSTDFSDTSGELNFLTPISGKDITREFTAGIKERCMLPVINCQAVTSVLDPVTGHISTVLTTTATPQHPTCPSTQPLLGGGDTSPPASATNKKPSYLNLACCVNGYSNLTTYDSKLRQDINKSREVSPSRPIIATLHYNRTESAGGGHLLTAPTLSYVSMNNTINNNYSSGIGGGTNRMFKMNGAMGPTNGVGTGGGRMRGMNGAVSPADVTDNASANGLLNGNGSFIGGGMAIRSKVISSQSQISSLSRDDPGSQVMTPKKSFIQQRVEKLYGASAEVVINKQYHSSSERKYLNNIANENHGNSAGVANGTTLATTGGVLGKGGQSITNGNGAGAGSLGKPGGVGNGLHQQYPPYMSSDWGSLITVDENNRQINSEEHEGMDADDDSLPVMRHLRPEFRKQLQIFSPKKVPKALPNRAATTANGNNNLPPAHTNGTGPVSTVSHDVSATDGNNMAHSQSHQTNGNGHIDTVDREEHSREEQTQHQENGCVTNRSTIVSMKSARISSHITTTTTTNVNGTSISSSSSSTTSNGHHETEEITDASSITRHHSNAASTRTSMTVQSNVTEQQPSSYGDCHASSTAAATPEMVEAKMRSLVVVPPPSTTSDHDVDGVECVSSQQESTVDSSSGATAAAIAVLPDTDTTVLKPATVATSVIENGEQNGAVGSSSNSDGLEHSVQPRVGETTTAYGGDKIVGEIVHCDSRSAVEDEEQKQALLNSMRTLNGGDTTVVVGGPAAASPLPMVSMMAAGIDRHHQVDAEEDSRQCRAKSAVEVVAAPATIEATTSNGSISNGGDDVLDGNYFLQILKTERHRLEAMADVVEKEISHVKADGVDIGEDLNGYILVAVGKARLLCKQKIKQFEDLCYTNLNQSPDEKFQTTGEDLRGFWDMVMLQVNNVDATFVEIDSFRKNGWRKPIPQSPPPSQARNGVPRTTKLVKRPYKTQTNGTGSTVTDGKSGGASESKKASAALAAAKREAQRKQLLEMKRKQKLANSQPEPAVEIFAPSADDGSVLVQLNGGDTTGTQRTTAAVVDATS